MGENVNLGENQKKWLKLQENLREIYDWLGKVETIPDESELEKLGECRASVHSTSCFTEGTCFYPRDERCGMKERK